LNDSADEGRNLLQLARQVVSRWVLVGLCVLAGAGLGAIAAFVPTPTYKAEATLAPADDDAMEANLSSITGGMAGLASLVGLSPNSGSRQVEGVLIMESRSFAREFIENQGLLEKLFADFWDADGRRWTGRYAKVPPSTDAAAENFLRDMLRVEQDNRNRTVRVSIVWRDPQEAAAWVNAYVGQVNERIRRRDIDEAAKSLDYLSREIATTDVLETRSVLYRLTAAQLQRSTLANVRKDYVFRFIDRAHPPRREEIHRPLRVLTISGAVVLGLLVGIFVALLLPPLQPKHLVE